MGEQNRSRVDNGVHTVEDIAKFFTDKIDAVGTKTSSTPLQDVSVTAKQVINKWTVVTPEQIGNLIGSALSKTCQLAPAWLIKQYRELLSPFVAMFFNESITTGCFPAKYKHAIITPLLMKSNLDADLLKSYRSVSNLTFLSELLEKIINSLTTAIRGSGYQFFFKWRRYREPASV